MRILYTAIFLLITAPALFSQTSGFAPVSGNSLLRSHAAQEDLLQASQAERLTGLNPLDLPTSRDNDHCPLELPPGFNLVESGDQLIIELDTFGLLVDSTFAGLTVLNFQPLNFGIATVPDSTIFLEFDSFAGLAGSGIDTVYIQLEQAAVSFRDTIQVIVHVKRIGRVVVADAITIDPLQVVQYCLDDELDFPQKKACSEFVGCDDDYDGEGQQSFHFTSYNFADTCLVYYASRFPGADTVCVRICDELTVCDEFRIPVTIRGDTITGLPFFEDFSTTDGPYPAVDKWLDRDVFINSTFAKDPPSVNMATFDGLDRKGRPYDTFAGIGDKLTSKPVNLSGMNAADSVILRFFISPKGYGLEPEVDDKLVLEFRNNQRQWVEVASFDGIDNVPLNTVPPFEFHAVPVASSQFFHKAFQFRFKSVVSPGGYGDWWHLDYIHLDENSTSNNFFRDVAFTTRPSGVLKNYSSMPWRHFEGHESAELNEEFRSGFFNHFNFDQEIEESAVRIRETTSGSSFSDVFTVVDAFSIEGNSVKNGAKNVSDGLAYESYFKNLSAAPFRNIQVAYSLFINNQDEEMINNDTVHINTPFSNYFAHDDGSAELQYFVQFAQGGEDVATCFHANVADSLKAIQFMFPHFTTENLDNQLFNIKVWNESVEGDVAPDPVFTMENLKPFFADAVLDTLQGFTTFVLENEFGEAAPVPIEANTDFCVGWEQLTSAQQGIPVGYDLTNACECNFARLNGNKFNPFSSAFPGSLMIRPVFGGIENTSTPVSEVASTGLSVTIYPNPTTGALQVDLKKGNPEDFMVAVFDQLGRLVHSIELADTLDLTHLEDGIYYLQFSNRKTGDSLIKKLAVFK